MNPVKEKEKPLEGYNAYLEKNAEKFNKNKISAGGAKRDYRTKENNVNVPSKPYEVKKN